MAAADFLLQLIRRRSFEETRAFYNDVLLVKIRESFPEFDDTMDIMRNIERQLTAFDVTDTRRGASAARRSAQATGGAVPPPLDVRLDALRTLERYAENLDLMHLVILISVALVEPFTDVLWAKPGVDGAFLIRFRRYAANMLRIWLCGWAGKEMLASYHNPRRFPTPIHLLFDLRIAYLMGNVPLSHAEEKQHKTNCPQIKLEALTEELSIKRPAIQK